MESETFFLNKKTKPICNVDTQIIFSRSTCRHFCFSFIEKLGTKANKKKKITKKHRNFPDNKVTYSVFQSFSVLFIY